MKIGFIGVGKITNAIVEGLCTSHIQHTQLYLSPHNKANAQRLAEKYVHVKRLESNQQVVDESDIIFIAVRPTDTVVILRKLVFREEHMVVSLVPLLNRSELLNAVAPATRVTRAVPTPAIMEHTGPILLFHSNDTVTQLFRFLGQPVHVTDEQHLHVLWTFTGLITPFYDLLQELSSWAIAKGVDTTTANQYIATLIQALSFTAQQNSTVSFKELAIHAETPGGMNEQAGKEIREKGAHDAYRIASDNLLKRFK